MTRFFMALDILAALVCLYIGILSIIHRDTAAILWIGAAFIFGWLAEVEREQKG